MNEIIGFKTISGQDVLARIVNRGADGQWVIEQARLVVAQPNQNGQVSIGMPPWTFMTVDGELTVNTNQMVFILESKDVPAELERAYIQSTTNIDLTSKLN